MKAILQHRELYVPDAFLLQNSNVTTVYAKRVDKRFLFLYVCKWY